MKEKKKFISTTELADLLGISRVAVHKRIKKGQIKATKVGRNYVIDVNDLGGILGEELSEDEREMVRRSVTRTVKEYGETLRLLRTS